MERITNLISALKSEKEKYGEFSQFPASKEEIIELQKLIVSKYNIELDDIYLNILTITNGFDNDGVVLYSSKTSVIVGYDDRYIEGIVTANEIWHEDNEKSNFLFYAESDMYLFYANILNKQFYIVSRDDLQYIVLQTSNSEDFFSKIIELSLGVSIEG